MVKIHDAATQYRFASHSLLTVKADVCRPLSSIRMAELKKYETTEIPFPAGIEMTPHHD